MSAPPELPDIVRRAFDVSRRAGYVSFCRNETGRLLATLAATRERHDGRVRHRHRRRHRVAALRRPRRRPDPDRRARRRSWPAAAAEIFTDDPQVEVRDRRLGDAARTRARSRCSSSTPATPTPVRVDAVADLVEPGGIVVLDDFTPCELWPPVFHGRVDTLREEWLTDERFTTVEVMVASDAATLIATRR